LGEGDPSVIYIKEKGKKGGGEIPERPPGKKLLFESALFLSTRGREQGLEEKGESRSEKKI